MKEKIEQELTDKYEKLQALIRGYQKVAVGFSGGVDSTFLLKVCCEVLGPGSTDALNPASNPDHKSVPAPNPDHKSVPHPTPDSKNVLAITAESPLIPEDEKAEASALCRLFGAERKIVKMDWQDMEPFAFNPPERCYLCKKIVFGKIKDEALSAGIHTVCDGSNADDALDYRPGEKAIRELGVKSPLREVGLTKQDIRVLSKIIGLTTWDKPAAACLASRVPYGERLTSEKLTSIEKAEKGLHAMGFRQVRVRHHGSVARIEVLREERGRLLEDETAARAEQIIKDAGFQFAALDLVGYRMGSLNPKNLANQ